MSAKPIHANQFLLKMLLTKPFRTIKQLKRLPSYLADLKILAAQQATSAMPFTLGKPYPCLKDKQAQSGVADGHYFHTDLFIAQRIHASNPSTHVDIGSRIDGFVAHVASFRTIHVIDIRPLKSTISNMDFIQADIMSSVKNELRGYCDSISCLHALEHFGLGRYGDPVEYDGYIKGLAGINAMLRPGGTLYLAVPIGPQRIEFNAHRVFSMSYLLSLLKKEYAIKACSYVDDSGELHKNIQLDEKAISNNFGCQYGCGILEMTKK